MDAGGSVRRFGEVFDGVAAEYDAVRPSYPAELVDAALEHGGLGAGSRVLEVGCGTGKLTELLVARGLIVDAVDPGGNMIELARRRVGPDADVRFHVSRFEDADLPADAFEAVFSATAFHWVDPAVGWRKAASHLRPGGLLALLTHVGLRDEHTAELDKGFYEIVVRHAPDVASEWRPQRDLEALVAGAAERAANVSEVWNWLMLAGAHELTDAAAAELFDGVELTLVAETEEQTADEAIARLRTTSLWFRVAAERREAFEDDERRLFDQLGGTVRWPTAAVLVTAHRADSRAE